MKIVVLVSLFFLTGNLWALSSECNRDNYYRYVFYEEDITDLIQRTSRGCHLIGADLSEKMLIDYKFDRSELREANFSKSILHRSRFSGSDLTGADFTGIKGRKIKIDGATLIGADFSGYSQMVWGYFQGSDMTEAIFRDANLRYAYFAGEKTILKGADFRDADLVGAMFNGADVRGADFRGAVLKKATFYQTKLEGALFDKGAAPWNKP